MKKAIFIFCVSFTLIFSVCFFVFSKNKENFKKGNVDPVKFIKSESKISLPIKDETYNVVSNLNFKKNKVEKTDIKKEELKNIEIKKDEADIVSSIVNKFEDQKFKIENPLDNFIQISENNIINNNLKKDSCVLNIVNRASDLSVCDFVKNECSDLECNKFDCIADKNNWFRVSYYGDFAGSGDKEFVYHENKNIIIANLECEDKSLERYDNKLFLNLIN